MTPPIESRKAHTEKQQMKRNRLTLHMDISGSIKCSDHRLVRPMVIFNLNRERKKKKVVRRKEANLVAAGKKAGKFRLLHMNKYEALEYEAVDSLEAMKDMLSKISRESYSWKSGVRHKGTKQARSFERHSML